MADEIVILITAPNNEEAEKISRRLVEDKLVACANIMPGIKSIFSWQGKISTEDEVLIIIKSVGRLFDDIVSKVKEMHSYSVPEIIALPIIKGSESYLKWINEVTV